MKLFDRDYNSITDEEKAEWEKIKENEFLVIEGRKTNIIQEKYYSYPKGVRHFLSLFPNNLLDSFDLRRNVKEFKQKLEAYKNIIEDKTVTERSVNKFIRDTKAYFIMGSILKDNYRFGHHKLFLFKEFDLPPNFRVDFLLAGKNSGGYEFVFVELKSIYGKITKSDGTLGEVFLKGINQIDERDEWLDKNFSHLQLVFEKCKKNGMDLPKEFMALDKSRIHYVIVAGKREDFSEKTYRIRRKKCDEGKTLLLHYDNLYDSALSCIGTFSY